MSDAKATGAWLLVATFVIAVAGLVYELIAATAASYLLGDSVTQFSLVIGVFLSAMGLGAWMSRLVRDPVRGFVWAQLCLGLVGGFSAPLVFASFAGLGTVGVALYGSLAVIGVLSGMEIPLIARVLEEIGATRFRFENVLTADYIGALVASIAFPFLIIPHLGLMSASLAFGCANLVVAGFSLLLFRARLGRRIWLAWGAAFVLCAGALAGSERMVSAFDAALYEDDIILSERTAHQQITLTRYRDRVRLFLDQSIQFDTRDEHRYHEALVHPAMALTPRPRDVLVFGGGDGMAVREVLRHSGVERVTLVDLDPRVTALFRDVAGLAALNDRSLSDPRVEIRHQDAWAYLETGEAGFDVIIADLPDPRTLALSKLYTVEFYTKALQRLNFGGVFVTQAGSPFFAREAFWTIATTLEAAPNPHRPGAAPAITPYGAVVPSFGPWGFVMAQPTPRTARLSLPPGLRFLTQETWEAARIFGPDTDRVAAVPNRLGSHGLLNLYRAGWAAWFQ